MRVAVPDEAAARATDIKRQISLPLVVDIHFDYRLALICMENGADKVRINPGNIGDMDKVRAVCDMAKEKHIQSVSASTAARWKSICCKNTVRRRRRHLSKVRSGT